MHRHRTPSPVRPTARRGTVALRAAALLTAGALTLGGCGLRLETPPPVEPSPDAVEQVRARTVDDALGLAAAAATLAAAGADEPLLAVLDDVATFSTRHAEELGGVYDSGLPAPTPDPATDPTPTPTTTTVTDVTGLLAELVDDAARAAGDADAVPDAPLARLVASVAAARDGLADRLASATGVDRPEHVAVDGTTDEAAQDGTSASVGDDAGTAAPTTDPAATSPAPDDGATPDAATAATPEGAVAVALAHDEASWTFTVLAARGSDERRTAMLAAAARHRAGSDTWARTAGVVGQPTDPRRAAYALPAALDDPAVADALPRTLEQAVAEAYANAVAGAEAYANAVAGAATGARGEAVAGLRTATAAAVAWGAAPVPFPGVPELATVPVG